MPLNFHDNHDSKIAIRVDFELQISGAGSKTENSLKPILLFEALND